MPGTLIQGTWNQESEDGSRIGLSLRKRLSQTEAHMVNLD